MGLPLWAPWSSRTPSRQLQPRCRAPVLTAWCRFSGGSQRWLLPGAPDTCSLPRGNFTQSRLFGRPMGTRTPSVAPAGFPSAFLWGLFTSAGRLWGGTESWHVLSFHRQLLGHEGSPDLPTEPPSCWGRGGGGWGCFHGSSRLSRLCYHLPKALFRF